MKQRIYNTLIRKLKIKWIAKLATVIMYMVIMLGYCFVCPIKKIKKNTSNVEEQKEKAREEVDRINPKSNMACEIVNQTIDEKIDLSIIMPAYNVEKYVAQCIESVLKQDTSYSYELIIVNDGSTDKTDQIIRKYNDDRIKYIVQDNQGLAGARNTGINQSKGKYITFVDSDDIVLDDAIEEMVSQIVENDADVVVGSHYMFVDGTDKKEQCILNPEIIENNAKRAIDKPGYAWGKVFKRELFDQIRFPYGAWYEDALICSIIYRLAKKMVVLDKMVYGYRINPKGISKTARKSPKCIDHYWVMEDVLRQADNVGLSHDNVFYNNAMEQMSTFLYRRISLLPEDTIKNVFILACDYIKKVKPENSSVDGGKIKKDLEIAFETGNYKLWKLASFIA